MKKILCISLCIILILPCLLVPASAAESVVSADIAPDNVRFSLDESTFIYEGHSYSLSMHDTSFYKPFYSFATSSYVYVFCGRIADSIDGKWILNPSSAILDFRLLDNDPSSSSDISGLYIHGLSNYGDISNIFCYYRFVYTGVETSPLRFVDFYSAEISTAQAPSVSLFFDYISYSAAYNYILCSTSPVYCVLDVNNDSSVLFKDTQPVVYFEDPLNFGFYYLNDGSWVENNFNGKAEFYYYLSDMGWSDPSPFDHEFPIMYQVDADTFAVLQYYRPLDQKVDPSIYLEWDSSINGYYLVVEFIRSTEWLIRFFDVSYDEFGIPASFRQRITQRPTNGMASSKAYLSSYKSATAAYNSVLASLYPVHYSSNSNSAILFWENPRGHSSDPFYAPIPPLDGVLPDIGGLEIGLSQNAAQSWKDGFDNVSSFTRSFLAEFGAGLLVSSQLVSLFADISPIRYLLYLSLFFGIFIVVFNLGSSLLKRSGKRSGG